MSDPPVPPITPRHNAAPSHGTEEGSARPSQFAHLSVTRFSDLIRNIDSASAGPAGNKRRRTEAPSVGSTSLNRPVGKPLGIADWAKAKADLRLERRGVVEPLRRSAGAKGKAASASQSAASTSSSYAPFSKARLLERIATYSLSTYNVRVSIASKTSAAITSEQGQQAIASLGRWLEPIGPALNGWVHLPPRSTAQNSETGAKNKLHCPTCGSSNTIADQITDLEPLFKQVQSLQSGHQAWCPWTRRSCHPSLYSLQSVEEDFVGRLSRTKARRVFRELATSIDVAADVSVVRPAGLSEEDLMALQAALTVPGLASRSSVAAGSSGEVEVSPPPSAPAIQLALCGWLPVSHTSSTTASSSSSITKRPRSSISSSSVLQCRSCSRKLTTGSSNRAAPVDPVREHRRFCPWVQADVQADTYLPSFKSVLEVARPSVDEVDETDLQNDGAAMLKAFQDAQQQPLRSASIKPSHPGWQINLRALLPSPGPASLESSTAAELPAGGSATLYSIESVIGTDEGPDGPDSSFDVSARSARSGGTVKRKRTSEILREARSLLFGTGGGSATTSRTA
ncbi:hypothetical protein BCV69DRAFT_62098 [Microstroma glucosiphilum]|uniref:Zf-C3HC-domain-containing protein n=1 Tax=Pseudomicrostroma glucosiphilum TaxID=1684307 RepID=A0A316U1N2_9BASI|nr:hypothetical protein BCV69DRAFT_62098 [Pseudomicrostroma glucosiphilum]PWN18758.1 hypothetical protein BCV69DRAFT_62098 [Pseudomicrostroma glucosiphilum]